MTCRSSIPFKSANLQPHVLFVNYNIIATTPTLAPKAAVMAVLRVGNHLGQGVKRYAMTIARK